MAVKVFVNCTSNPVVSEAVCAKVAAALGIDAADVVRIPPGFSVSVVDVSPAPCAGTPAVAVVAEIPRSTWGEAE